MLTLYLLEQNERMDQKIGSEKLVYYYYYRQFKLRWYPQDNKPKWRQNTTHVLQCPKQSNSHYNHTSEYHSR